MSELATVLKNWSWNKGVWIVEPEILKWVWQITNDVVVAYSFGCYILVIIVSVGGGNGSTIIIVTEYTEIFQK